MGFEVDVGSKGIGELGRSAFPFFAQKMLGLEMLCKEKRGKGE